MKRTMLALLAAAAALPPAVPAHADQGDASLRNIYEAGRCIVDNDRSTAISFLQSLPIEEGEADLTLLPDSLTRRCARGLGTVDSLHVRGAMAQALFFRDFGGFGIEPGRSVPLVNLNIPAQSSPPGTGMTELYRWADCVVRNRAAAAEPRRLAGGIGRDRRAAALHAGLRRRAVAGGAPVGLPQPGRPERLQQHVPLLDPAA
jgi:hypothetical protein